jgi:predicted MFS family arabinose efflux permease
MQSEAAIASKRAPFHGWRMVALAFVILNLALGVNFTAYGALVEAIQREFHTTRALASAGPSVLNLAMGLMAPFAGAVMRRVPLKTLMLVGIALNALGYLLITQVHSIALMLACYALLIGPGFCLIGVIPCTTIVSNWFVEGRGRAIGIINMPFGNTLMPLVAAFLLQSFGLRAAFLGCGVLLAALVPLILALVDRPERIGQRARGDSPVAEHHGGAAMTTARILRFPPFWVLTLGVGLLSAGGMVMVSHLVALGMGRGLALSSASLLLAGFGVAGVAGAPIFGWLSDRLGGGRAFAILCFVQVIPWLGLIVAGGSLPALLLLAMAIGLCSNAITTLFGTTTGEWLGAANVSAGMGLCYLLQIPFLFGAAPLAGAMFDATGGYGATILLHAASFAAMGLVFLLYRPRPVTASPPSAG